MTRGKLIRRIVLGLVIVFLLAGAIAPFVQVNSFKELIRTALQNSLRRKVQVGEVHFSVFSGLGFSVADVVIEEDPALGIEPFAYVNSLDAKVGLSTLWTGRLQFSSLVLDEPSVNLVKPGQGPWNVIPLMQQAIGGGGRATGSSQPERLPGIKIRGGRLNFKFGDVKSPFYFTNANVDVWPRHDKPGSFDIKFSGEPARTDRTAQGFGTLNGGGRFLKQATSEGELDLYVELEKSAIDEMARLVRGRDFGLHGLVSSKATLKGPLSNLQVIGQLQLEDIHRWDLLPSSSSGGLQVKYRGMVDWRNQKVELFAGKKDNPTLPVAIRARLFDYLSQPHWAADVTFDQLPASGLVEVSRHMGAPLPKEFSIDGKVVGVLGYASTSGLQGQAALEDATLSFSKDVQLAIKQAAISLDGDRIHLAPAMVTGKEGQSAELEGTYQLAEQALNLSITARSLSLAEVQTGSGNLLSSASLPLMEHLRRGKWTGTLRYQVKQDGPGKWDGSFDLRDAVAVVPGFAEPVEIAFAALEVDGPRIAVNRLRAQTGNIAFAGEYRYEPDESRPHKFKIAIPVLDAADLEAALLPSLRRDQSFIARTLRLKAVAPPDWLKDRHADGTIRVAAFTSGPMEWKNLRTRILWDGTSVDIGGLAAELDDGEFRGRIGVDMAAPLPRYRIRGQVQNLSWKSGKVDVEGRIETRGTGADFLANLRSEGSFQARGAAVVPDSPFRAVSGSYEFWLSPLGPKVRFTSLQASAGNEKFSGQGETQLDGKLQLDFTSATRVMRMSGTMVPWKLDMLDPVHTSR